MRILLAQNALYYPAYGGGDRSNRLLLEALAARGHACRVVARIARFGAAEHAQYLRELAARAVSPRLSRKTAWLCFTTPAWKRTWSPQHPNLRAYFAAQIAAFEPDVILTSTDDPAQLLLEVAVRSHARTVYLARATLALPFGPDCAFPSAAKTEALRQAAAVVGVSQYVADYIRQMERHPGRARAHLVAGPAALSGPGPLRKRVRHAGESLRGEGHLDLPGAGGPHARRAVCRRAHLGHHTRRTARRWPAAPNVTLLDPVDNVDDILRRTRVLLVPSLWAEARSRIVVEAMLRGVPVMASHIGGIPEAKLGVDYLLPVRPIERYQRAAR